MKKHVKKQKLSLSAKTVKNDFCHASFQTQANQAIRS